MTSISNTNPYPDKGMTNEVLPPAALVSPINTMPSDQIAFSGRSLVQKSWFEKVLGIKAQPVMDTQQLPPKSSFPTWLKASLGFVGAGTLSILAATGLHHLKAFDLDKSKWTKWLNMKGWFKKSASKAHGTNNPLPGSAPNLQPKALEDWSAKETDPVKFQNRWSELDQFPQNTPETNWTKRVFLWNWSQKETDSIQLQRIWTELAKLPKEGVYLNETKNFVLSRCSDIENDPEKLQSIWSAGNLSEETPTLINGSKCDFLKNWSAEEKKPEQFQFIWDELEKLPADTSNLNENKRSVLYNWSEKETEPAHFQSIWSGLERLPVDHPNLNMTKAYVLQNWTSKETDLVKLHSLWARLEALPEDTPGLIAVKAAVKLKHPNINGK